MDGQENKAFQFNEELNRPMRLDPVGSDGKTGAVVPAVDSDVNNSKLPAEVEAAPSGHERGSWSNQLDFLFSCIGYAVGLGNVWRFPYYCFKNGGGAFLVPYFIAVLTCGIPIFVMEITLGQYFGVGNVQVLEKVAPILKGTGLSSQVMIFHTNVYYAVVIAWGLFYLAMSFSSIPGLPWSTCGNWWNTDNCFDPDAAATNATVSNETLAQITRALYAGTDNQTLRDLKSPVEEYWERRALQITTGIDDAGGMQWELLGFLALGWVLTYFIIWKGLHNSGKIIWFTAIFPYVVLTILLIRAVTLPGAGEGLLFYVTPDFERLKDPTPWLDAGSQVFFSFGLAVGTLFALGSYNSFTNNCFKDAIIVGCINSGTSLYAGVVTFSVLGFMAHERQLDVKDVVDSGPGLAFLVYPEVVAKLPGAPIWAILFFLMFCMLGIDTLFCTVEGFVTALVDSFPGALLKRRRKVVVVCCICFFLLALPMVSKGGVYLLTLADAYGSAGMTMLLTAFCQAIAFNWIWGDDKVANCLEEMTGRKIFYGWRMCWKFIGPGFMLFIFVFYFVNYAPVTYGDYAYPTWAQMLGVMIAASSMVCIPGYAFYYVMTQDCSIKEAIKRGFTASKDIAPRGEVFKKENKDGVSDTGV